MLAGLPAAMVFLAQAATAATRAPADATAPAVKADDGCSPQPPASDREIVICAERPNGYRIDPDILSAKRHSKNHTRPKPPSKMKDTSCTAVGPGGCIAQPGIDMLAAVATLARMADRLAKGQEIGSMFVTDPQPSEYQLYKEAKAAREAEEAEKKAKARAKAAAAAAASPSGPPPKPASEGD